MGITRREAIRNITVVGAGVVALATGVPAFTANEPVVKDSHPLPEGDDVLLRLQHDLQKALTKPVEQRHWIMAIDLRKCVGCFACTVGCVAENKLPPGIVYRPVSTEESGQYPDLSLQFTPRPCMQCDQPPCVPVCPVKATFKRPDGVVPIKYNKCIGCRRCIPACPYGARTFDRGDFYTRNAATGAPLGEQRTVLGPNMPYETQPNFEYGIATVRKDKTPPIGKARKCHFCLHRVERGLLPICVSTCIGRATYFGDERDKDSLIVKLLTERKIKTLQPEKKTLPQVFYIIG